jgi:replicative DNA helicase
VLQPLAQVREDLVRWATSDIPRVPTGYSLIDKPTGGGPAPGELLLFIARTGVGKTWWALNVLNANPQTPAIFFSLEMHSRYLLKRLAGIHTATPTKHIEKALIAQGWSPAVEKTVEDFPYLHFADAPGIGIPDMMAAAQDYADSTGRAPKLIVVDFMELVQAFGMTETESVKKLAKSLKDMAREIDSVVIVLHQVGRGQSVKRQGSDQAYVDEGHRPLSKGHAMHGGEASADYMVGAFRPALDPEMSVQERLNRANDFRLQFLKTRGDEDIDPLDAVQHHWDQPTGRISEIDWRAYR